jgi:hypothetical protein
MRGEHTQKFSNLGVQPQAGSGNPMAGSGPSKTPPRPGELMPLAHPGRHFRSSNWQAERIQRAARICRCLNRGLAKGKKLGPMLQLHAWRWKDRCYTSDPKRKIQFTALTLRRMHCRWEAGGRNPEALALRYWAPVKIRRGQAVEFARACLRPEVSSFIEAHGRMPRPRATFWAYRLNLPAKLRGRIIKLFAARRLTAFRMRSAREAVNRFAGGGGR